MFSDLAEASKALVKTAENFEPSSETYDVYDKNFGCYKGLYTALKTLKQS